MGAPPEDAAKLHDWSMWIQRQFDPIALSDPEKVEQIQTKVGEFYAWVRPLIETRRDDAFRRPDLVPDRDRGGGREAVRGRAREPRPEHPRRRGRHDPEPARPRDPAARRAARAVGEAAGGPRDAGAAAPRWRRSASSRSRPFTARQLLEEVEYDGITLPGRDGDRRLLVHRQPRPGGVRASRWTSTSPPTAARPAT